LPSTGPVSRAYEALVGKGALTGDDLQREAVAVLDTIAGAVEAREAFSGFLGGLFKKTEPIKGAYLYGDVGRGKSMLMDLFFESVDIKAKRRVHFHEFMDEIHAGIAKFRARAKLKGDDADPVAAVVKPILKSVKLLCLDEFHVNDITNAMLLGRLFEKLFAGGVVLVTTSNVQPDGLYKDGLNRELILPFIALLKKQVQVVTLNGPTDYRRLKFEGQQVYFFGAEARAGLDHLWSRLTGEAEGAPTEIESLGRKIHVPRAAMGVARFEFADLCEKPLGARDYLRLAHAFDAVVIDNVPQFDRTRSNAAKRFILLVDTLYDRGVKLAASFAVPLEELGADDKTRFEFARCVSRLIEMGSEEYLNAARKPEAVSL
jgi:cell division protein ZapE